MSIVPPVIVFPSLIVVDDNVTVDNVPPVMVCELTIFPTKVESDKVPPEILPTFRVELNEALMINPLLNVP